ncbi:LpxL/LpxP family Kdo(2)-lipid IV(A) lauroyl/palmitoleoyl acyltransferase [Ectothiorhodospira shaposhnikovii]|uniref:LpxL/LpxP family Kdo(2)-lipid IV(A) lauroyl/palmitoleoyl acyltransferase n=1 Tax=Ectothiorhodospira shaposhnikovii TaxID=1054 RepID=UPI001EE7C949|nr:LpxL/LpxP family Kdo(2)-lipid IV(A) lauroyl/palmitoleoyl acyltransferase [Ectothiorhodospira shaposhnikovii]MCG5513386.1 LpxL/LpxP family Kdo(2)-lipid IV(A) lauroyl/palmitoleoyl acyltransferase [Ectothiorhodospira shaposhnikovii]
MARKQSPSRLYHPVHWPMWLGVALFRTLVRVLPWHWQIRTGETLGALLYPLARRRRRIAEVNVGLCFPDLDPATQKALVKAHFRAMGAGIFETPLSWWGSDRALEGLARIEGLEHLQRTLAKGKGALLLSAHFTTLELAGRLLCAHQDFAVMYRPHENPVMEHCFRQNRQTHYLRAIRRDQARDAIRVLKQGQALWYAPDQAFKNGNAVIVPFFGVPAATNPATARLAKISGAPVIPFFGYRLPGRQGYRLVIGEPLEDFPGEDPAQDARRINAVIEAAIRVAPEQYFWTHRRFKYKRGWGLPKYY